MKKRMLLGAALVSLLSCVTQGGAKPDMKQIDAKVAAMTPCEKVHALIEGHSKGFPMLKLQKTEARLLDVWKARYHLVGDACQVWQWGQGQFSYMCALSTPNQQTAMDYYEKAKMLTAECLGAQWQPQEGKRELGEGLKTSFVQAGNKTVVGIHAVATPGLFKDEWTTYYFVGSPNHAL